MQRRSSLKPLTSGFTTDSDVDSALGEDISGVLEQNTARIRDLEKEIEKMRAAANQLEVYTADLQRTCGELESRLSQMQALHRLTIRVASQQEPDAVLNEALVGLRPLIPHGLSAAYIRDRDGIGAERRFVIGEPGTELPEHVDLADGLIGRAMLADGLVSDLSADGNWLALPLRAANQTLGVIVLREHAGTPMSAPDRLVAEMLAAVAAQSLQNAERYRQVSAEAVTDALTGVYNYRHFREQLPRELSRARRMKYQVGLVMADLDHFKDINDRFGHPEGDRILRLAADAMQSVIRHTDFLARVGGEEFAVILPACGDSDVKSVCEKLRAVVAAIPPLPELDPRPFDITVSLGGAATDGSEETTAFIERADSALLIAKRRGRNCSIVLGKGINGGAETLE
jgi:diguanylate cyclase (GGDEF)-like protein